MALSDLGSLGTANHKTSSTGIAITTTQATAVGDIVTVQVATDNSVSTVGETSTHTSVTDTAGNTYTKVGEQTNGTGGANAGVTLSVWRSVHTSALASGDSITFARSGSVSAKAMSARRFGRTSGSTLSYPTPQTNAQTGVPAPLTISGMTASIEKLMVRCAAVESNAASITTETSGWTLGNDIGTSGGSAATNVSTRAEYLIGTGTSYTSEPSGNNLQGCSIMFAVVETVPITLNTLTWASGGSISETASNGTQVGTLGGKTSGASYSLTVDAGGRFAINSSTGVVTVANATLLDYETNTSHSITVRETLAGATNTPKDTVLSVSVVNVNAPVATAWAGSSGTTVVDEDFTDVSDWTVGSNWSHSGGAMVGNGVTNAVDNRLTRTSFSGEAVAHEISFTMGGIPGGTLFLHLGNASQSFTGTGPKTATLTPFIATSSLYFRGGSSIGSDQFFGTIDDLLITTGGGGPAPDPEIDSSVSVGTHVADLNKTTSSTLAITGGTGASLFELYANSGNHAVRTSASVSEGSYTLNIQDTTVGPSGSGEDRTDTLTVVVTGAAVGGKVKVRLGGAWTEKPVKARLSGAWVEKPLKVYVGGAWVLA